MQDKAQTGYPSIDKPWLKYYSEEAIQADLPDGTAYEYLYECNRNYMEDVALVYYGKEIRYRDFFDMIDQIANAMLQIGLKVGDTVSVISMNCPETLAVFYAANKIGVIIDLEYPTQPEDTMKVSLQKCNPRIVFIMSTFVEFYENCLHSYKEVHVIVLDISNYMGKPYQYIARYQQKRAYQIVHKNKWIWLKKYIKETKEILKVDENTNAVAVIVQTSGTTGTPKKVMLSNRAINSIAWQYKAANMGFARGDRYISIAPLFLSLGISLNCHGPLCLGLRTYLAPDPDDKKITAMFVKIKPQIFMGGPLHMCSIMQNKKCNKMNLSFLKILAIGGASMTEEQERSFQDFLDKHHSGVHLCTGYGMTELSATATTEMNGIQRIGSVGVPQIKVNTKIVDIESQKELPYGEIGEILFCTPGLMEGYMEGTEQVIERDEKGNRWIHTGDLGCVDRDGFVYIKGRIKRIYPIIDSKSNQYYKLFPDYIERELQKNQIVKNCAVAVIHNVETFYEPIAFVVLKQEKKDVTKDLKQFLEERMDAYLIPKQWYFIERIPMLPSGKIDYRQLEESALEKTSMSFNEWER